MYVCRPSAFPLPAPPALAALHQPERERERGREREGGREGWREGEGGRVGWREGEGGRGREGGSEGGRKGEREGEGEGDTHTALPTMASCVYYLTETMRQVDELCLGSQKGQCPF